MKRQAGLALDLVRANLPGRRARRPFKLTFSVTDECSCRCAICHLWKQPRKGASLEEIEQLFRANPFLAWINLTGGEVLERTDFVEIVRAAHGLTRVCLLDFPTAGQQPEQIEDRIREVLRLRLPRLLVSVSLDGPPEVHDRLRGTQGAFARAAETLQRLKRLESRRFRVYAGLTISSANEADPEQLVTELLQAVPCLTRSDLHFNLAHHSPHAYRNAPTALPDRKGAHEFFATERQRRPRSARPLALLEAGYWKLAQRYLSTQRSPIPCTALSASAFVDPDLRLFPCISWDHPLVDLRTVGYSLEAALEQARVQEARSRARGADCPNCWTPCEAFPNMLSSLARTATACLLDQRPAESGEPSEPSEPTELVESRL